MSARVHFTGRSVAGYLTGRLGNHLVDLHEMVQRCTKVALGGVAAAKLTRARYHVVHLHGMIATGMQPNHFSHPGKMGRFSFALQRAVQESTPEQCSSCSASTVGASLAEPASGQAVLLFSRAHTLRRVAQVVTWAQKGGVG